MRNIALVGCGNWGKNILRDLLSLNCHVFVIDTDAVARKRAETLGAQGVFESIAELPEVDGYVIAVPIPDLTPVTSSIIRFGKPIFVEKTLLCSESDYHLIKSISGPEQVFAMHKWCYHPGIEKLKQIAASGKLGEISELVTTRYAWVDDFHGGDVFLTQGIHDVTIVNHILGYIPDNILAINVINGDDGFPVAFTAMLGKDPTVIISVSGKHTSKTSGVSIHGTKGTAELKDALDDHIVVRTVDGIEKIPISTDYPLFLELKEFLDYLDGDVCPRCDLENAWKMSSALLNLRRAADINLSGETDE